MMKDILSKITELDSSEPQDSVKNTNQSNILSESIDLESSNGSMTLFKELNSVAPSVSKKMAMEAKYREFKKDSVSEVMDTPTQNIQGQQNISSLDNVGQTNDGQVTPQQLQQMKAQQLKSLADQKKQVQDQIRQTEKLLVDLRKKLTDLNNPNNVSMMAEDQDDEHDDESNQENLDHREDFGEQSSDSKKVTNSDKTSKKRNKK